MYWPADSVALQRRHAVAASQVKLKIGGSCWSFSARFAIDLLAIAGDFVDEVDPQVQREILSFRTPKLIPQLVFIA
jgi:hypothetical protein